ncbi:unnamed protein product [Dovyalis caffra]|uniref:Peptidase S54 rhomboid domain-containing protein n=1 Tax=Dovyalis caffra TaxID=77055 RepID=A0AAV1SMT4_9ROSI|nr:unnamed protein product [Dovyalis caffra]
MQGLLSLRFASSNLSKRLANNSSLLLSHPYKTFTKPTHPYQNHSLSLSHLTIHSCQSHHIHNLPAKFLHGFLSKHFLSISSNSHFRVSSKNLTDCKVGFFIARFARGYSGSNPILGSYRRGWRSRFNRLSADDVVLGLIIANAAVFMLWRTVDQKFMMENFMVISVDNFRSGRVHTLITSAFSHIDIGHIVSNMIGLYFFGTNLYLAGAIGGSVFYLLHHGFMALSSKGQGMWVRDPSRTPGLGASGAVNAIMLLDIFLNPRATLFFDFIIPVPAILLGIFLIGKDMLRIVEGDSNISGSAHLGGAAVAAITWARIKSHKNEVTETDNDQASSHPIGGVTHGNHLKAGASDIREQLYELQSSAQSDAATMVLSISGSSGLDCGEQVHSPVINSAEVDEKSSLRFMAAAGCFGSDKDSGQVLKGSSPFKLVQDYASEDCSKNNEDLCLKDEIPKTASNLVTNGFEDLQQQEPPYGLDHSTTNNVHGVRIQTLYNE